MSLSCHTKAGALQEQWHSRRRKGVFCETESPDAGETANYETNWFLSVLFILLSVARALRARRQTDRAPVRCLIEPSRLGPPGTKIADGISGSPVINDASD